MHSHLFPVSFMILILLFSLSEIVGAVPKFVCVSDKFLLKGMINHLAMVKCPVEFIGVLHFVGIFFCVCDLNLVQSGQIVSKHSFFASIMLARRFEEI